MTRVALFLAALCFSWTGAAQTFGVFGGINSTVYEDGRGTDYSRDFGLEAGITALYQFQQNLGLRTGAGFVGKNSSLSSRDYSLIYLEVPATLMFRASPSVQLFGGLNLDFNISKKCVAAGGGSCGVNANSVVVNLPLGARVRAKGPHYVEPILEFGLTDIASGVEMGNSFSVRYVYLFSR